MALGWKAAVRVMTASTADEKAPILYVVNFRLSCQSPLESTAVILGIFEKRSKKFLWSTFGYDRKILWPSVSAFALHKIAALEDTNLCIDHAGMQCQRLKRQWGLLRY